MKPTLTINDYALFGKDLRIYHGDINAKNPMPPPFTVASIIRIDYYKGDLCCFLFNGFNRYKPNEVSPILRNIADMTEEESSELEHKLGSGLKTRWYLDKQFDVFGWIAQGLAVDMKIIIEQSNKFHEKTNIKVSA